MRVLHVTEALGGGITTSLLSMVDSTPDIDHHLLASVRSDDETGDDLAGHFASVKLISRNPARAMMTLRHLVSDLYPDVVHAHSSIAGLWVRTAGLAQPRIVYTPHGFVLQRRDMRRTERDIFEWVERKLVVHTDLVVAVSPHEQAIATGLGHQRVAYAPNRSAEVGQVLIGHDLPLRVVAVGRLCAAKDPRYFLHLKRYCESKLGLDAQWQWLGGGEPGYESQLRAAGVEVSGWIPRDELLSRLRRSHVYVHTAAWDASPMSVLEAASIGLPMVIRSIATLGDLDLPGLRDSVPAMGARIVEMQDPFCWQAARRESRRLAESRTESVQGAALRSAYQRACAETPLPNERLVHSTPVIATIPSVVTRQPVPVPTAAEVAPAHVVRSS